MSDARKKCQSMNADLPIINSVEENTFIADLLKEQGAKWSWIGLQRNAADSKFYWVDGSTPVGYDAWKSGEPNNVHGKENCAYIEAHTQCERPCISGGWNDIHCDVDSPAVLCQKAM